MSKSSMKIGIGEKIGYGFGDFASVLFWQNITLNLMFFYTDVFGISAVAAGTMIMVSRLVDGVYDPFIGMVADRTKTRWGKFRPYLLFMSLPLALTAFLAFFAPGFNPALPHIHTTKLVYAYGTLILFMMAYATINIPYSSLLGVITSNPVERTGLSSSKYTFAYIAGMVVSATSLLMAKHFGHGSSTQPAGWRWTIGIYGIIAIVFFLLTFLLTKERIRPMKSQSTSIKKDLSDLFKNMPWVILLITTILMILFVSLRIGATNYYFKYFVKEQAFHFISIHFENLWYVIGSGVIIVAIIVVNTILKLVKDKAYSRILYIILVLCVLYIGYRIKIQRATYHIGFEEIASIFNSLGQGFAILGAILVPFLSKWTGKRNGFIILFIIAIICTASFYVLKAHNLYLIFILQILGSVTGGPLSVLIWAMYADAADYSEWKNNRRATGLIFSASAMSQKLGWAVGGLLTGGILSLYGYVANTEATSAVTGGLIQLMSVIPAVAGILAIIAILFYKLDDKTMKTIEEDLNVRRAEYEAEAG
jgi:GPH family glycoside/pentoside/hexuronide:cation symporter